MTQPIPYPEYPASAPEPQFWQGLMTMAAGIMMLIALASWAFSMARKALKGEEVERPF